MYMGYTTLINQGIEHHYDEFSLEGAALRFIRQSCENLRFSDVKEKKEEEEKVFLGKSREENQIPYNMQMDIDRLCLENAINRFLKSGKKEDAFDVYFCYLEMFVGDYDKTRRMIELLSEFEANGSRLLMKHRDHYSHSVYVFILGLAIYETNSVYKRAYGDYYELNDGREAACHFLKYWGLASLFHDIGYPFELPFEQVCSYFEVDKKKRVVKENEKEVVQIPFVSYNNLDKLTQIKGTVIEKLKRIDANLNFSNTNQLFAYLLSNSELGKAYCIDEKQMLGYLESKPVNPDKFTCYMDHAYFSSTILFKKMFEEMDCEIDRGQLDALTAILMHNSLYKFCIANPTMDDKKDGMHASYKKKGNIPFNAELHPLAYMLMLCDELQCWDRTAYGRNSKMELHPMGCEFKFQNDSISATYLFDEKESAKINEFKSVYKRWQNSSSEEKKMIKQPELKAFSKMYIKDDNGETEFQSDIESIVDLSNIKLETGVSIRKNDISKTGRYLSNSNFINLYNFALVLNGRWEKEGEDWKKAKKEEREESFILSEDNTIAFMNSFKKLSLEYKLSNINQAKAFARYMDVISCFYTDQPVDFEMVEEFADEELQKIGVLEHQRWLQEHYEMGWEHGNPEKTKRDLVRQHKDMLPEIESGQEFITEEQAKKNYDRLGKAEQDKDTEPMECMLAMLKMFDGIRIYRL